VKPTTPSASEAANTIALLANPGNMNTKTDELEIPAAADRLKQHLEVLTARCTPLTEKCTSRRFYAVV
jgi:hypothetical protein